MLKYDHFVFTFKLREERANDIPRSHFDFIVYHTYNTLPVSQLVPSYPGGHKHWYSFTRSTQVAPFKHGSLAHSWISAQKQRSQKSKGFFSFLISSSLCWLLINHLMYWLKVWLRIAWMACIIVGSLQWDPYNTNLWGYMLQFALSGFVCYQVL